MKFEMFFGGCVDLFYFLLKMYGDFFYGWKAKAKQRANMKCHSAVSQAQINPLKRMKNIPHVFLRPKMP